MSSKVMYLANSPYAEASAWSAKHAASGSGISLARLLLTLRNGGYSISECILGLDSTRLDLALRVIHHFAIHGANEELIAAERHLEANEPSLVAVIQSAAAAREALKLKS